MINNPYFLPSRDPSNYAIQLIADTVGFDCLPIDVFNIPKLMDYEVIFSSEDFENINQYGFSDIRSEDSMTIYLNANFYGSSFDEVIQDDIKRRHCRFTLAHELGHCTMPEHKNVALQNNLLNKNNLHSKRYNFQKEYEANIFASELLIPAKTIDNIYKFGNSFYDITKQISSRYDASMMASALKTASLMDDSICICLQISKTDKTIIGFKYSKAFKEYGKGLFIAKNSEPYSGSLTNALLRGSTTICTHQQYQNPRDWFPNFRGGEDAILHEWAFDMGENIITFLELIDTSLYSLYIN